MISRNSFVVLLGAVGVLASVLASVRYLQKQWDRVAYLEGQVEDLRNGVRLMREDVDGWEGFARESAQEMDGVQRQVRVHGLRVEDFELRLLDLERKK